MPLVVEVPPTDESYEKIHNLHESTQGAVDISRLHWPKPGLNPKSTAQAAAIPYARVFNL